jgi:hypothetical protein
MQFFLTRGVLPLVLLAGAATASAAPAADSAYITDPQTSRVEDATSKGIGQVNMITCVMSAMKPDALVNKGGYIALVDQNKCDPQSRSSTSHSGGGGTQAANYMAATVDSSRTSNTDPMIVKVWLDDSQNGQPVTISVHTSATAAPSAANPYGQFRLDFCGKPAAGAASCMMQGYLEGATTGLSYYQSESRGQHSQTVALRLTTAGTTTGSGSMQMTQDTTSSAFNFAYDANLFRRSDGNADQCFSRDASDPATGLSVWRYGLYDSQTGARVTRNSGFPIEYTANGHTYEGYLGYFGLSLPPDATSTLTNGATVAKVDYPADGGAPTRTSYTVVQAAGKLTKHTKQTRTLHEIDKIRFNTWVGSNAAAFFSGATPNTEYELYWNDSAGTFTVTAMMSCGRNGCQTRDLQAPQTVGISFWASQGGVQGSSQALGGDLFINLQGVTSPVNSTAVPVVYRTQDLVYPSDLPPTLYCVRDCPTAASLGSYFAQGSTDASPFASATFNNWNPTPAGSVVGYTSNAATALLVDGAGQAVTFTNAQAFSARPQFQWGVNSGRLFVNLADAACSTGSNMYCDWKVNDLPVYYQWKTGPNNWNQFAAVKDSSGKFVTFDAPLQVTYQVPAGIAYGQYAGKSIVLEYGGFGDLWGIPGSCVSGTTNQPVSCDTQDARYVPSFVIPADANTATSGQTTYLVKWLDREIRFASKSPSVCANAGLILPTGSALPTAADLNDPTNSSSTVYIGTRPTVTDPPRVIQGDVKF